MYFSGINNVAVDVDGSGNVDILKNLNMFKLRERIKYKCLIRNKKYLKVIK